MSNTTLRVKLIRETEKAFLVELLDYGKEEWWPKKHSVYDKKLNKETLEVATWSLESKQKEWAEKDAYQEYINKVEIQKEDSVIKMSQETQQERNDVVDLAALLIEAKKTNQLLQTLIDK